MEKTYLCLKHQHFIHPKGYELVPIRVEDVESIRIWRNAQIEVLRQKREIGSEEQKRYFDETVFPIFRQDRPSMILLSFLLKGQLIGYGGLTNIDWEAKRAEISFLVNPERLGLEYEEDFRAFLELICQVAFGDLKFYRLFTETFAFRKGHIALIEAVGFKREGILREHVYKKGGWQDSFMHGLLASEWEADGTVSE